MRKLTAGAIAVALALAVGQAAAEVRVTFVLENAETHEIGKHISASPGDKIVFKLFVKNLERERAEIVTDLTASIPGCIVNRSDTDDYRRKRNKKFRYVDVVPKGESGVLNLSATATSSLGNVDSDTASVTVAASKSSGAGHRSGGIFARLFLQAMMRAMLASDDSADQVQSNFSSVKSLYR